MRIVLAGIIAGAAALLAACETGVDEALVNDPIYQLGYTDGCQSAHAAGAFAKMTRNKAYAGKSHPYDRGWSNGYAACGGPDPNAVRRGDVYEDSPQTGRDR